MECGTAKGVTVREDCMSLHQLRHLTCHHVVSIFFLQVLTIMCTTNIPRSYGVRVLFFEWLTRVLFATTA